MMRIELLYLDGCPGHEAFLPRLRALLDQADVRAPVELRRVESEDAARRERFLGSPTLRIDGADVEPGASDRRDYGLTCRLYPAVGGLAATPPDAWVLDALRAERREDVGVRAVPALRLPAAAAATRPPHGASCGRSRTL
jgi:hypothetical protein